MVFGLPELPKLQEIAKTMNSSFQVIGTLCPGNLMCLLNTAGTPSKRHWSAEEEEAVKRGVSKFGPGSWKEIKEDDVTLANRSVAQIKEKVSFLHKTKRMLGSLAVL